MNTNWSQRSEAGICAGRSARVLEPGRPVRDSAELRARGPNVESGRTAAVGASSGQGIWAGQSRSQVLRPLFNPGSWIGIFILAFAFCAQNLSAQTNAVLRFPANRWLLVAQTSSSMKSRADLIPQLAAGMVWSGMGGQMEGGDTLGLWTFNEALYLGSFPLQVWTTGTSRDVARQVYEFLKSQKYEKDSHLDYAMVDILGIIKASEFITVIVISDGEEKIHGTPFDDKLNASYQTWKKQQQKARLPFLTVLRGQHGQITHCSVTVPPWPLDLPPLPSELQLARTAAIKAAQKPPPQPAPAAPPLIISGKKTAPQPVQQPSEPAISNAPPSQTAVTNAAVPGTLAPSTTAVINEPATHAPIPSPAPQPSALEEKAKDTSPEQSAAGEAARIATSPSTPAPAEPKSLPLPQTSEPPAAPAAALSPPNTAAQAVESPRPTPPASSVRTGAAGAPEQSEARFHAWIIALGATALVLAVAALSVVLLLARRLRVPKRISLVTPRLDPEEEEKK